MTIYKKLSSHGSINIPVAVRRDLGLEGKDPMELTVDGGEIRLRAYTPRCTFCGTADDVKMLSGRAICPACIEKVRKMGG